MKWPFVHIISAMTCLVLLMSACMKTNKIDPALVPTPTSNSVQRLFRVIAYVMDPAVPSLIPYDKLTHINYAFLTPNQDGTFNDLANPWKVEEIINLAHANKVKVLISVGGWGWDKQFESAAADATTRTVFVNNLKTIVDQYQFDGVDMDWEYPDEGQSSQDFLALMQELRTALPKGKLLTAAVVALGPHGMGIPSESFALMDFVNVMAYDDVGAQHSSFDYANQALDYWLGRGLPPEKVTLGVPFYARPTEVPFSKIVQDDPKAAQLDSTTYDGFLINYNGIPTIQAKTRLAMQKASGIMFWRLENDAPGDLSLLSAIHQVVVNGGK
jgi:chitinase